MSTSQTGETVATKFLVADYVKHRLDKAGLPWNTCPDLPKPGKVQLSMRNLGDEFESRYNEVFQGMCDQLHVTQSTAYPAFISIINDLFSDGIKWGRIVALFSFGGALAVNCVQKELPPLVDQIVEWVTNYIDVNLQSWIQEHDGWKGFVEFYEGGPERRDESPWPSMKTLCGYVVGAVGILTLGAILAQKST